MRKSGLLFFVFVFTFICIGKINADTVYVNVMNNFFSPATFTANVGDQVKWTLMQGNHTTTSMTIPSGAASWNYTFTGVGDTYVYEVTIAGDYSYECVFHPGMVGNFTAETVSGPLVEENFEYAVGSTLVSNGYTAHSGSGTNSQSVITGNLSYPGYPSSGIGNMLQLVNTGEDVHKTLASNVATGTVYASFLVNVDSARAAGDYFFHLGPNPISTTFRSRVFVKLAANGNLAFGLSKGSTSASVPPVYTDSIYQAGTTYLIVAAYEIIDGATNDLVKLWVNPDLSGPAPMALITIDDPTNADISVGSYAFRQGGSASGPYLKLDGLRIFTIWDDVVPVELTSFTAASTGNAVTLNWSTASEVNNSGFEVERRNSSSGWTSLGFVQGNGTTTEAKQYSFIDNNVSAGNYSYRLKQIDFDGTFEYSNSVEVEVSTPSVYELAQNYPNPFNPSTSIKFNIPEAGNVKLIVYNLLGQEVNTLVNEFKSAGSYTINFDATNLTSGVYLYKIEANGFVQTRKMMLIK